MLVITYNQEEYVESCLEGIRLQTRTPDEVIIGDDGSKDGTQQIISDYVARHNLQENWTLLFSEQNRGITANLQTVIDASTADILLPVAGDDVSLPERCQIVEQGFAEYPDATILLTSVQIINEMGDKTSEIQVAPGHIQDISAAIRRGNAMANAIGQNWRRTLFSTFGPLPNDVPNEDTNISFRALLLGGIVCIAKMTVNYRIHNQSESAWLHRAMADEAYLERMIQDMSIRARHMNHWAEMIAQSDRCSKDALISLARRKQSLYLWLAEMRQHTIVERLRTVFANYDLLSLRDAFYSIFGCFGVLLWRRLRRLFGKL